MQFLIEEQMSVPRIDYFGVHIGMSLDSEPPPSQSHHLSIHFYTLTFLCISTAVFTLQYFIFFILYRAPWRFSKPSQ